MSWIYKYVQWLVDLVNPRMIPVAWNSWRLKEDKEAADSLPWQGETRVKPGMEKRNGDAASFSLTL